MGKFLIALFAIFAVASAQDLCQRCGEGVMALGQYLQTEGEIAAVEQGLIDLVCTTLPEENIDGCATAVLTWWPDISKALFEYEGTAAAICVGIGACKKTNPLITKQDVTCAECEEFLAKIADLLETPDFAAVVAADLNGAVFCENPDYIDAADVATCQDFMGMVAEKAVAALGSLLRASASRICT